MDGQLTPRDIERAVSAYLRRGKGDKRAGTRRAAKTCPVAKAARSYGVYQVTHGSVHYWERVSPGSYVGRMIEPTPRVARFIALVDAEGPGLHGITMARSRELWREARKAAAA